MIFQVILAIIVGRIKGYRIGYALTRKSFIPFYIVEFIYVFFQINAIFGNFAFVPYARIIKSACLYTLLLPIFIYKLYLPALAGSGLIAVGSLLNELAKHANGGKMPVYPTLSRLTGYFTEEALASSNLHILGNSETKLKFLTDYIDYGCSIISIGDVIVQTFVFIVFLYVMKAVTNQSDGGKKLVQDS